MNRQEKWIIGIVFTSVVFLLAAGLARQGQGCHLEPPRQCVPPPNDYANAIAAYQTAHDLDQDNAKLSLSSHYGLLGNLYVEPKSNYVL